MWPQRTTSAERSEFEESLWRMSPLQFAVLKRQTGELIGLVQGLSIDDRNRTVGVGFAVDPVLWRQGWPFEGVILFINFLIERKGFRKIYFQMPASNVGIIGRIMEQWVTEEVVLRDHIRRGDSFEDWHIFSLTSETWTPEIIDWIS
jgi:RimJ/RimL family protein N-acetyltransferase